MTDTLTLRRYARAMRRDPTDAERRMWSTLRNRGLAGLKFRRQAPIGRFIADFACFDPKIIVELDGSQHLDSDYDAARDAWFRAQGFAVVRVWNGDAMGDLDGVCRRILAAARRA